MVLSDRDASDLAAIRMHSETLALCLGMDANALIPESATADGVTYYRLGGYLKGLQWLTPMEAIRVVSGAIRTVDLMKETGTNNA